MGNDNIFKLFSILTIIIYFITIIVIGKLIHTIENQKEIITKVNEARIKADNKPCCKLIQERYIDRRISEDGLNFIYEEHPQILECE